MTDLLTELNTVAVIVGWVVMASCVAWAVCAVLYKITAPFIDAWDARQAEKDRARLIEMEDWR